MNDALGLWHLFALNDAKEEVCNRRRLEMQHELLDKVWLGLDWTHTRYVISLCHDAIFKTRVQKLT